MWFTCYVWGQENCQRKVTIRNQKWWVDSQGKKKVSKWPLLKLSDFKHFKVVSEKLRTWYQTTEWKQYFERLPQKSIKIIWRDLFSVTPWRRYKRLLKRFIILLVLITISVFVIGGFSVEIGQNEYHDTPFLVQAFSYTKFSTFYTIIKRRLWKIIHFL